MYCCCAVKILVQSLFPKAFREQLSNVRFFDRLVKHSGTEGTKLGNRRFAERKGGIFAQILSRIFFLGNMSVDFSSLESLKKKDKNLGCVQSKTSSTRRLPIQFSMDHSGSRIPPANCWEIVRGQFGFVASTSQFPQVRGEKKNKSPNFEKDACSTGKSIVAEDRIFPPDSTFLT